jgi:hypothetical protein
LHVIEKPRRNARSMLISRLAFWNMQRVSCLGGKVAGTYIKSNNVVIYFLGMEILNVLIGCEESQEVCKAFRELGHNAYSCDLEDCSGGHPEWHLKMDIFDAIDLKGYDWNLAILHPPCTAIAVSGNATYAIGKLKYNERLKAIDWTQNLWDYTKRFCPYVALENPVGCLNTLGSFPKPQYIQPWQFGHGETKKTGLWLHNLPNLKPTKVVEGREQKVWKMPPSADRQKLRSKTYTGIAAAMAEQWSEFIINAFEKSNVRREKINYGQVAPASIK